MNDTFSRLAAEEPQFDPDGDTAIDEVTRPFDVVHLAPPGALPVSYFMRPGDGFKVGPIIIGSFAYKRFIDHKWVEVQS